jgi:hypothetical protein
VFVHEESKSVQNNNLIASIDIVKMSIFVKLSKMVREKMGDDA